jgi:hypothetical protein
MTNEVTSYSEKNENKDLSVWIQDAQTTHLSDVFSAENLPYVQSFGNRTLAETAQLAELAILNCQETERIWNRSHSQWTWRHINLSYAAPFKNLRQVSAEVSSKREALEEAKWNWLKTQAKIKIKEEQIQKEQNPNKRELLEIELAQMKSQSASGMKYVEGAMKDVITLSELYDQLKRPYEGYSEADFEQEEAKSHLKRSLVQCLRDIRQSGRITKGEQEYLEQIGANPGKVFQDMIHYLQEEEQSDDYTVTGMYNFLDTMCDKLIDQLKVDEVRMQLQGLEHTILDKALFKSE